MSCKYCNNIERKLDDEITLRGGYPLSFEGEKTCGSFDKITYINIQDNKLTFKHFSRGGGDSSRITLPKVVINFCPVCGRKL